MTARSSKGRSASAKPKPRAETALPPPAHKGGTAPVSALSAPFKAALDKPERKPPNAAPGGNGKTPKQNGPAAGPARKPGPGAAPDAPRKGHR